MIRIQRNAISCAFVALSMLLMLQPASAQIFFADFEDGSGENNPPLWVPDNDGQAWGTVAFLGSGQGLKNLNEGCFPRFRRAGGGILNFANGHFI